MTRLLKQTSFFNGDSLQKEKLFSYTRKINDIDPLLFFKAGENLCAGERFYWQSSDRSFSIVGMGVAASFTSTGENRFEEIAEQWNSLLKTADLQNDFNIPGVGPVIFGGFSFDEKKETGLEWAKFGQSLFYLPKVMLTLVEEECYLTINKLNISLSSSELNEKIEEIISSTAIVASGRIGQPVLLDEEELHVEAWLKATEEIVDQLKMTALQKVVMSRKMKLRFSEKLSTSKIIKNLLAQQSTSFIFAMEAEDSCFLGASPERLIKKTFNDVLSTCLAGSIHRGVSEEEDRQVGEQLLQDEKNLFEHELVVSMIEDALRPYCEQMSIPSKPQLMKTPDIQHLYTPVKGTATMSANILNMVKNLHPTPALGGVPTGRALEIIREKEQFDRGFYASPIGWIDFNNNGEFIVGIRSGLIKENEAKLYAGCGLVAASRPAEELVETRIKFKPMLRALGGEEE